MDHERQAQPLLPPVVMNARAAAVDALERRLGRPFNDRALLERALTHASVGDGARGVRDNEVLEFIGDRVIGLLAAERLAKLHPASPEGDLAPRLNALVSGQACAHVARLAGIGPALRLSGAETKTGGRDKDSILAGACEALMAAIYEDGGLEAARAVFLDLWAEPLDDAGAPRPRDPKTALQEWAQGRGKPLPAYAVTARGGPDHQPVFTVQVDVEGLDPASGEGRSRQEAEKAAAALLLAREEVW
jgi:ribonuclease-3